jgi:hypothetical protein
VALVIVFAAGTFVTLGSYCHLDDLEQLWFVERLW